MKENTENYLWRTEVNKLLQEACNCKVVRGGISLAYDLFDKAQSLLPERNSDTWKANINYRKAHICFRYAGLESAEGNEDKAKKYLKKAIEYFTKAEKSPCFAQLSQIYAIPACLRLGLFTPGSDEHLKRIKKICSPTTDNNVNDELIQIDINRVNLTEISAYYACFWTTDLEGRVNKYNNKGCYTILSSYCSFEEIAMTKEFAKNEIKDIIKSGNYDIAFDFIDENKYFYSSKKTENTWKECQSKNRIGVILAMFNKSGESASQWFSNNLNNNNFRKYKNDLKVWLSEELGIKKGEIFTTEHSSQERLSEKFRLFVAVPRNFSSRKFF
ncbi:MAG: hypothetical protein K6G15_07715 [Desulfovibrio sp.]|nr:hypothetical protein [Desulfovibrio sp.]